MKTINQYVQMFNTFEGAQCYFANLYKPGRILQVKNSVSKYGNYFVDTTPKEEEQLHVVWPDKYTVLRDVKHTRT